MYVLACPDGERCYPYVVGATLEANDDHKRRKNVKTGLKKRMVRITGFSRTPLARRIGQHPEAGRIVDRRAPFGYPCGQVP